MFVLICGCGRVGSTVARAMLNEGHQVSVLDEDAEALAMLERNQEETWEDIGGQFTVGTALEIDALLEAGIEQADALRAATGRDHTNHVVSQLANRRFNGPTVVVRVLVPARAQLYEEQGLSTVCPTAVAIDMLQDAVRAEVKR